MLRYEVEFVRECFVLFLRTPSGISALNGVSHLISSNVSSNELHRHHFDNLSHSKLCCSVIGPSSPSQSCLPFSVLRYSCIDAPFERVIARADVVKRVQQASFCFQDFLLRRTGLPALRCMTTRAVRCGVGIVAASHLVPDRDFSFFFFLLLSSFFCLLSSFFFFLFSFFFFSFFFFLFSFFLFSFFFFPFFWASSLSRARAPGVWTPTRQHVNSCGAAMPRPEQDVQRLEGRSHFR